MARSIDPATPRGAGAGTPRGADAAKLREAMSRHAEEVEAELERLLPRPEGPAAELARAMRHGCLQGGKRLRPFLVAQAGALFGAEPAASLRAGAALELVHCYSLIHDDLPAMDDADLRRGRPTVHKLWDDATAVLAGDALLTLAFEAMARDDWPADPATKLRLARDLAVAAGFAGMCGGQRIDLDAESRHAQGRDLDLGEITHLQRLKTGALIAYACEAGARLGGAGVGETEALLAYARLLGLAFQIKDDLLDVQGDEAVAGKSLQRDQEAGKATFVSLLGERGAEAELERLEGEASATLDRLGPTPMLRALFAFVVRRSS